MGSSTPRIAGPLRQGVRLVGINLLLLLIVAAAAEVFFGSWFSSDPLAKLNIQRDTRLRIDPAPLYPGGTAFTYERDHWGFRGAGRDPATIDILTAGGSTTNQLYLPEQHTWQAVAASRLAELGRPQVIANSGLDGQTSVGLAFALDRWFPNVPGLRPKIVLALIGLNDALFGGSTTDDLRFSSIHKWIDQNSALYRLGRTVKGLLLARTERLTHVPVDYAHAAWTDKPNFPDNRTARPNSDPQAYAERLRAIAARIRDLGAEPVFVTQSRGDYRMVDGKVMGLVADHGMNGVDQWRLLDEYNHVTLDVCVELRLFCLDQASAVVFQAGDFYDVVHATPQGAARSGRWLGDELAKHLGAGKRLD
jgi:lysophospholipase L1-like esterase